MFSQTLCDDSKLLCCLQRIFGEWRKTKRCRERIFLLYSVSRVALIMKWISNVNSCCAGAVDTNRISAWQLLLSWHGWKESRAFILHNDRPQVSLAITSLVRSFDLMYSKRRREEKMKGERERERLTCRHRENIAKKAICVCVMFM